MKAYRLFHNNKGQVAPFLVMLIAVLLLAIVATMLIGEGAFNKIRAGNIGDGTLISASSSYCRSLNQLVVIKGGMWSNALFMAGVIYSRKPFRCCSFVVGPGVWHNKAEPFANGSIINGIMQSNELHKQAEQIKNSVIRTLRSGLYDGVFSGGLIDEPKPFLQNEVNYNAEGKITGFNFDDYTIRDSRLTINIRAYKRDNPAHTPPESTDWYMKNSLVYYYNKTKEEVLAQLDNEGKPLPGKTGYTFTPPDPSIISEAYLKVTLKDVPTGLNVLYIPFPIVFGTAKEVWHPCGFGMCCSCVPGIGVVPVPYASITSINPSGGLWKFGIDMERSVPYKVLFFSRQLKTENKSRIWIRGNINSGYEPKME